MILLICSAECMSSLSNLAGIGVSLIQCHMCTSVLSGFCPCSHICICCFPHKNETCNCL